MFWIAASANVRGVTKEGQSDVLRKISVANRMAWHEGPVFVAAWEQAHDDVVRHYAEKVQFYAEAFMATPAGQTFKNAAASARKRKGQLPGINVNVLRNFQGETGMEWRLTQICDFWKILGEVSFTCKQEIAVQTHLMKILNVEGR